MGILENSMLARVLLAECLRSLALKWVFGIESRGLSAYSVSAIVCNEMDATSLQQVRLVMANSFAKPCFKLALLPCQTCCMLADLQSKIAATLLQTKIAVWNEMAYAKVLAVIVVLSVISGQTEGDFTDALTGFGDDIKSVLSTFMQNIQNDPSFNINNTQVQNELNEAIQGAKTAFNLATNSISNLFSGAGGEIQDAINAIKNGQNPLDAIQQEFQQQESQAQTAADNFQQSVKNLASTTGSPN
ncbi:hypothetical protein AVEN_130316-1 [Araneus ventricosus]|uniref:Uncharacterized protein n=1 Tax=Araneus ventricosus TaxID=182803 RepID=A0A4Y2BD02_ARAVE|nr:hypothetical protein AVEN_130316-1 [Araneus ventricosus]